MGDGLKRAFAAARATRETKRQRQEREGRELDEALAAWVEKQSSDNTHQLYRKACAYLGIQPVVVDEEDT